MTRILLFALCLLIGCSEEYPSCPLPSADEPAKWLPPDPRPEPGPGPDDPGPSYPGPDNEAEYGYRRIPAGGQVCRCTAEDVQQGYKCSAEPPSDSASDPVTPADVAGSQPAPGVIDFRDDGGGSTDLPACKDETELGIFFCPTPGPACVPLCEKEQGVWCPSGYAHPFQTDGEVGLLSKCCGCVLAGFCAYIYKNGEECFRYQAGPWAGKPKCVLPGGKE
jgi:hypothetical protein